MAFNKKKRIETMIAKFGSHENYLAFMRSIAAEGGRASNNGGFASNKVGRDGLTGRQRARNGNIGTRSNRQLT